MSMRPTVNGKLCLTKQRKQGGRIRPQVPQKQQGEADNEAATQPDDTGGTPPGRNRNPSREFPHRRFFHLKPGTYENPYRPTAEEVSRKDELSENPRASTMGRTRSRRGP